MKKAVKAILNVLSYGGIEVESARRLADINKLDPIRIFLRKLDMEIYNGDYKVPIRLFFPDEKMEEHGAKEAILFFHGGGWTTESVETYDRVCARMAQSTGQIVVSVEYRLAPEYRFPTGLEDCYAAAQAMLRGEILPEVAPENVTIKGALHGYFALGIEHLYVQESFQYMNAFLRKEKQQKNADEELENIAAVKKQLTHGKA